MGARVLGLASTAAKQEAALRAGADAVATSDEDWVQAAQRFSRTGTGVDVAYDSVGITVRYVYQAYTPLRMFIPGLSTINLSDTAVMPLNATR